LDVQTTSMCPFRGSRTVRLSAWRCRLTD